jgi:signal transduction histidine kinase/ActR/RegA family two-component response regulator
MAKSTSCQATVVTDEDPPRSEERFLILAPTGRDAVLTYKLLRDAGLTALVCQDVGDVCRRVAREGAMALLLAEEVLTERGLLALSELLGGQPAWSDLPILLFTGTAMRPHRPLSARALEALGNVTLLERPLRPVTMLSAANAALRARKRQYMARDELKAQKEQVRQRDQFLAMLGHELRNPLSAITMAIELESEDGGAQYKAIVKRQARHLTRLVDDLLDVARVTSGKIVLQRAPLEVTELVRRTLLGMNPALLRHELSLRAELPEEELVVEADSVRLEQILVNLLNNAIKYTPPRGQIEVQVSGSAEQVELRVRDDGAGIAPEMLPRVFDLFAQAEGTLDRAKGGMGIGLTLVKSLVRLHGGSIAAESAGLGHGSTFVVRLPRAQGPSATTSTRLASARAGSRQRDVLIIEDNDDSRELMTSLLTRRSHKVSAAADGPSGVELALRQHPSAILVDIGLPGLDGYAVARELRPRLGSDVLMIAVTGYGQPEDKRRALEAGFDAHLTKPVDVQRLELLLARGPKSLADHALK